MIQLEIKSALEQSEAINQRLLRVNNRSSLSSIITQNTECNKKRTNCVLEGQGLLRSVANLLSHV